MKNIFLKIRYKGTNYCGFQIQQNGVTIQGEVERALFNLLGQQISIIGCSRTDSGVHANECVVNFFCETKIPMKSFAMALNTKLPRDIVCFFAKDVPEDFHSRYSCKGKEYVYRIENSRFNNPINNDLTYRVFYNLDIQKMRQCAKIIVGKKDFVCFMSAGGQVNSTIREIYYLKIIKNNDIIEFRIAADGFLYNMVRIIVGTLLYVGAGKLTIDDVKKGMINGDRTVMGITVPPDGLYLNKVFYDEEGCG